VARLLRAPAFDRLRADRGQDRLASLLGTQIDVIEGDLDSVPELPADIDLVVHCAGEVSFDPPIDVGFASNVLGTHNLLAAVRAAGIAPHYVQVSTAYVAGGQPGYARTASLEHQVDWRVETDAARRLRA